MEKLEITYNSNDSQPVLTVLEGKAIVEDKIQYSLDYKGNIFSPLNFWELKNDAYNKIDCTVFYSIREGYIKLVLDEGSLYQDKVLGELKPNPELDQVFGFGTKMWQPKDLAKELRYARRFFRDPQECSNVVQSLSKVSLAISSSLNREKDDRGNEVDNFSKSVTGNMPESFILKAPIFIGTEPREFEVEICCDVVDKNVKIWLESVSLHELIKEIAAEVIEKEIEGFEGHGVCCIQQG